MDIIVKKVTTRISQPQVAGENFVVGRLYICKYTIL